MVGFRRKHNTPMTQLLCLRMGHSDMMWAFIRRGKEQTARRQTKGSCTSLPRAQDAASPRVRPQITSSAADSLALKKQGSRVGPRGGCCISYITSCCDLIPEKSNFRKKGFTLIHPSRV